MEKKLDSIYLDPSQPASFGGLDAVYRAVKEKGKNKISRKQVRDWLSQQDVYTLHKPARRRYKRSRVIANPSNCKQIKEQSSRISCSRNFCVITTLPFSLLTLGSKPQWLSVLTEHLRIRCTNISRPKTLSPISMYYPS